MGGARGEMSQSGRDCDRPGPSAPLLEGENQFSEGVKKGKRVVGARACLRVVLDGQDGVTPVAKPFYGSVVQVDLGNLQIRRERVRIHGVTMVLSGDDHLASRKVFHRLVATAVAKFELERLGTQGEAEYLMPQADSE